MKIPHLRGCYDQVGGLVYFGRMVDKIRLHDAGRLPADYHEPLGQGFDGRTLRFLGIGYAELQAEVRAGRSDEELFAWACRAGRTPSSEDLRVYNGFLGKLGWRDGRHAALVQRLRDGGFPPDAVETHFDFIELDEGRPLRFAKRPASPVSVASPIRPPVEGLRSPYDQVGGLVHFGRMLDKIRLHARGKLPADYIQALGGAFYFDGRICTLLGVKFEDLAQEVKEQGGSDEALLEWAQAQGRRPSAEEIETLNGFLSKRGWRDETVERLHFRLREAKLPIDGAATHFDFIDLDEGRPPRFAD